jgi:hypothetical protein
MELKSTFNWQHAPKNGGTYWSLELSLTVFSGHSSYLFQWKFFLFFKTKFLEQFRFTWKLRERYRDFLYFPLVLTCTSLSKSFTWMVHNFYIIQSIFIALPFSRFCLLIPSFTYNPWKLRILLSVSKISLF